MRNLIIALFLLSCYHVNAQPIEVFNDFHDYFKKHKWKKLDAMLTDDFTMTDHLGNVINKEEFIQALRYSGYMKTRWEVKTVEEKNGLVYSDECDHDIFNDYFFNGGWSSRLVYHCSDNQIEKIEWDTIPGYNSKMKTFGERSAKFNSWMISNYPDKIVFFSYTKEFSEMILRFLPRYLERKVD